MPLRIARKAGLLVLLVLLEVLSMFH